MTLSRLPRLVLLPLASSFLAAFLAAFLAGCGVGSFGHRSTRTVEEYALGSAQTVKIKIPAGSLVVEATTDAEVLVAYDVIAAAQDEATLKTISLLGELAVERAGDTLEISTVDLEKEQRRRGRITYAVRLKVPADAKVLATCPVGSISATGLDSPVLETNTGQIKLENGSGAARLVNQAGRIRVKAHRGTLEGSTTTGGITASFTEVSGEGDVALETAVGSITIELPDDTDADISVDVGAGSIDLPTVLRDQNENGVKGLVQKSWTGTLGDGGRTIRLRAKTGDVTIRVP